MPVSLSLTTQVDWGGLRLNGDTIQNATPAFEHVT